MHGGFIAENADQENKLEIKINYIYEKTHYFIDTCR